MFQKKVLSSPQYYTSDDCAKKQNAVHFFFSPCVGRLSLQLLRQYTLVCLHLVEEKKCFSRALVWINFDNSKEYLPSTNISLPATAHLTITNLNKVICNLIFSDFCRLLSPFILGHPVSISYYILQLNLKVNVILVPIWVPIN